jgi:hypothetical protein
MLTLFLATLMACDAPENPTGECDKGEGGRPCYHSPEPTDTYMPICDGSVDRELWRVFATTDGPADLIPRPDASGLELGICDGDNANLVDLFERTGLCEDGECLDIGYILSLEAAVLLAQQLNVLFGT